MSKSTIEVLKKAKGIIEDPKHWFKGTYYGRNDDGEKCFCAVGAVAEAVGASAFLIDNGTDRAVWALRNAVPVEVPTGKNPVPFYNDHPDTTHADILALFDTAIGNLS